MAENEINPAARMMAALDTLRDAVKALGWIDEGSVDQARAVLLLRDEIFIDLVAAAEDMVPGPDVYFEAGQTVRVIVGDDGTGDRPIPSGESGHYLLLGSKATVTDVDGDVIYVKGLTRRNGRKLISQSLRADNIEPV